MIQPLPKFIKRDDLRSRLSHARIVFEKYRRGEATFEDYDAARERCDEFIRSSQVAIALSDHGSMATMVTMNERFKAENGGTIFVQEEPSES